MTIKNDINISRNSKIVLLQKKVEGLFKPVIFEPSNDPLILEELKKIEEYTQKKNHRKE